MRLLALAATNSWQGRIAGSRIACVGRPYHTIHSLRGHVNKNKFQKSKKTLEGGGWVKCPIGYKKKLENIFLCIISFGFGEHSNVYNVINAPLCHDCLL